MGGASSYLAILSICGFLSAAWLATKLSKLAGVSSIVLEITTGVVLGPSVLGLITEEYATCEHRRYGDCAVPADLWDRLAEGKTLGKSLDRMIDEHFCDPSAYHHGDDHGAVSHGEHSEGAAHGDDAAHGAGADHGDDSAHGTAAEHGDDSAHGSAVDHGDTTHDATHGSSNSASYPGPGPTQVELPLAGAADHSDGGDHAADSHAADGDAAVAAADAAHSNDHHRRLSGGGSYHTLEECLVKQCQSDISHSCGLTPDVFTLIGHAGVALMIFESGMHFDFDKAQVVGPKACAVAVLGTILPLITGTLLTVIYGKPLLPDGISVGTALAPTSVGIALRLLGEAGVLQHDFGQAIITAAFVDDILSLVLFNVLFSLRGEFDFVKVVLFPIIGIAFMAVAMVLAVKFWPWFISDYLLPKIPVRNPNAKISGSDEALFVIMFALLIVYATTTHFLGTHLWGCFIAGMSFACVRPLHHPHHVWVKQTKRITSWMIRIFFAATVAFSIPVSQLLSIGAFLKGSVMGIGPCILTKVCCAPFMGDAKFVIGWAMVGRAEFAYLIAQMAAAASMIDEETFSICIWALLYATIFAPFIFRTVLNRYIAAQGLEVGPAVHSDDEEEEEIEKEDLGLKQDFEKQAQGKTATDFGEVLGKATMDVEALPASGRTVQRRGGGGLLNCLLCGRFGGSAP